MNELDELITDIQNVIDNSKAFLTVSQHHQLSELAQTTIATHSDWLRKLKAIKANYEVVA